MTNLSNRANHWRTKDIIES